MATVPGRARDPEEYRKLVGNCSRLSTQYFARKDLSFRSFRNRQNHLTGSQECVDSHVRILFQHVYINVPLSFNVSATFRQHPSFSPTSSRTFAGIKSANGPKFYVFVETQQVLREHELYATG